MVKKQKISYKSLKDFIDSTVPCRNGNRCTDKDCKFLHNVKTRMCKFADRCRRKDVCFYAHNEKELYVPNCKFGTNCNNPKCGYKHPDKNFWDVSSDTSEHKNNDEHLEKKNFPQTIKVKIDHEKTVVDYKNMKEKIKHVDHMEIKGDESTILSKYASINSFDRLTFVIE